MQTPVRMRLEFVNRLPFSILRMQMFVSGASSLQKKKKTIRMRVSALASGTSELEEKLLFEQPGEYEYRIKKVRLYDMTGLFYVNLPRKAIAGTTSVLVLPPMYAAGYYMERSRVRSAGAYYQGSVPDSRAHAWVEIYLDNIGWFPVEMTPGYQVLASNQDMLEELETPSQQKPQVQRPQKETEEESQKLETSTDRFGV